MNQMSPYLSGILLSYAAAVLGLMSPGPNILAVIGTSMGVNRKAGISLALGVSAGALLWGLLTGAGLTALLTAYASARSADIAKPSRMAHLGRIRDWLKGRVLVKFIRPR